MSEYSPNKVKPSIDINTFKKMETNKITLPIGMTPIKKSNKRQGFSEYITSNNRRLFDADDYDFDDVIKLKLIAQGVIHTNDENLKKKAAFYIMCEKQLES